MPQILTIGQLLTKYFFTHPLKKTVTAGELFAWVVAAFTPDVLPLEDVARLKLQGDSVYWSAPE